MSTKAVTIIREKLVNIPLNDVTIEADTNM